MPTTLDAHTQNLIQIVRRELPADLPESWGSVAKLRDEIRGLDAERDEHLERIEKLQLKRFDADQQDREARAVAARRHEPTPKPTAAKIDDQIAVAQAKLADLEGAIAMAGIEAVQELEQLHHDALAVIEQEATQALADYHGEVDVLAAKREHAATLMSLYVLARDLPEKWRASAPPVHSLRHLSQHGQSPGFGQIVDALHHDLVPPEQPEPKVLHTKNQQGEKSDPIVMRP